MPKKTVVLFENGKEGGRIYVNPPSLSELQKRGRILIDPKIPRGIPPHKWYVKNDEIFPKGKKPKPYLLEEQAPKEIDFVRVFLVVSIVALLGADIYRNKEEIKKLPEKISKLFE